MNKLDGLRVSRGIAVGRALTPARRRGRRRPPPALRKDAIEKEVARFDRALRDARDSLYDLRRGERAATEITAFIDLYLALLSDPQIARAPRDLIRERHITAEWALDEQIETVRRHFRLVKDPYLRERGDDIRQVAKRILDAMSVRRSPRVRGGRNWIVVAADLSPADVIEMSRPRLRRVCDRKRRRQFSRRDFGAQHRHAGRFRSRRRDAQNRHRRFFDLSIRTRARSSFAPTPKPAAAFLIRRGSRRRPPPPASNAPAPSTERPCACTRTSKSPTKPPKRLPRAATESACFAPSFCF